jgi:hypothetical protein
MNIFHLSGLPMAILALIDYSIVSEPPTRPKFSRSTHLPYMGVVSELFLNNAFSSPECILMYRGS